MRLDVFALVDHSHYTLQDSRFKVKTYPEIKMMSLFTHRQVFPNRFFLYNFLSSVEDKCRKKWRMSWSLFAMVTCINEGRSCQASKRLQNHHKNIPSFLKSYFWGTCKFLLLLFLDDSAWCIHENESFASDLFDESMIQFANKQTNKKPSKWFIHEQCKFTYLMIWSQLTKGENYQWISVVIVN